MKFYLYLRRNVIRFYALKRSENVLDKFAFIYLVQTKFDGQIQSAHPFWDVINGKRRKFLSVEVEFPDYERFDAAKYHCGRNLTQDGEIRSDYVGALDAADPDRVFAKDILNRAIAAPSSN